LRGFDVDEEFVAPLPVMTRNAFAREFVKGQDGARPRVLIREELQFDPLRIDAHITAHTVN
jgi:hypothetical protein